MRHIAIMPPTPGVCTGFVCTQRSLNDTVLACAPCIGARSWGRGGCGGGMGSGDEGSGGGDTYEMTAGLVAEL